MAALSYGGYELHRAISVRVLSFKSYENLLKVSRDARGKNCLLHYFDWLLIQ